jgi:integrase-like protein
MKTAIGSLTLALALVAATSAATGEALTPSYIVPPPEFDRPFAKGKVILVTARDQNHVRELCPRAPFVAGLPDMLVEVLRDHRKGALELRMQLGVGRLADDALSFATIEGRPLSPNAVSAAWADFAASIGMPHVTFHALRHTHASQLIHEGVDIVTISKRLGHVKPDITLRIYAHMFEKDDSKAAAAINAVWKR